MKQLPLSDESIGSALEPFGFCPPPDLCRLINTYIETLVAWNRKIALTTVIEPSAIVRTHFGESFFAAARADIREGRVADIGSGPGFPGIPIRMVAGRSSVTLVEAVAKKAAFLNEVTRKLGLSDLDIIRCRMEDYYPAEPLNFVTARALGQYPKLVAWAERHLAAGGQVVLLLGEREVENLRRSRLFSWSDPAKIPATTGKFVLIGRKPL